MEYKFKITQFVKDYVKVGDEYRHVEAESKYEVNNYDDLSNLLLTLIDFGADRVKFEVKKEEVSE
jgi:hypothetical protein